MRKLESIVLKIGTIQNRLCSGLRNPAILVFATDHSITAEGYYNKVRDKIVMLPKWLLLKHAQPQKSEHGRR